MCGKDNRYIRQFRCPAGSPPHVRERPITLSPDPYEAGITPACAGKTLLAFTANTSFRDHPRMCGKDLVGIHR